MEIAGTCCYCEKPFVADALRPYGFGGRLCCWECAEGTPQRRAERDRRMDEAYRRAKRAAVLAGTHVVTIKEGVGWAAIKHPGDLPEGPLKGYVVPLEDES